MDNALANIVDLLGAGEYVFSEGSKIIVSCREKTAQEVFRMVLDKYPTQSTQIEIEVFE